MPFKMHKIIFFFKKKKNNQKIICVPTLPKIFRPVTQNTLIFIFGLTSSCSYKNTGQSRYVKLAYHEYTAYVKVIIHSRTFPIYCIVFLTCLCQSQLSQKLSYIEEVFLSRKLGVRLFTTVCVEVKICVGQKVINMNVKQSNLPSLIKQ